MTNIFSYFYRLPWLHGTLMCLVLYQYILLCLSHSPPTIWSTVNVDSWLPRAKLCCFPAKSDRCTGRARRSDGSRCCSRASMNFNAFARCVFLRLPRSYRVAEKSDPIRSLASRDPIAENHEKSMVFIEFLDDATRSSQTEKMTRVNCVDGSTANFVAPEHTWATNGELARFSVETQKQPYYLFFFT